MTIFWESINDNHYHYVPIRWRKPSDEIHGHIFPYLWWNRKRLEQACWNRGGCFGLLASQAFRDKSTNILVHRGPKELTGYTCLCSSNTCVATNGRRMILSENSVENVIVIWHNQSRLPVKSVMSYLVVLVRGLALQAFQLNVIQFQVLCHSFIDLLQQFMLWGG